MFCHCGSNEQLESCCLAIIKAERQAQSPEQLMRSRFSAYVIKDAQYIFDSYSQKVQKSQSISDIKIWANTCQFIELVIHHMSPFNDDNSKLQSATPTVEFTVHYLITNKLYKMSEKSRFIKEPLTISNDTNDGSHWVYLDGDVYQHIEVGIIKRNDLCPCAVNKAKKNAQKFKKCCGKSY